MDQKKGADKLLKKACKDLCLYGITKAEITYMGSGDSGCAESIDFFVGEKLYEGALPNWDNDTDELRGRAIKDFLMNTVTAYIDGDWYNNEGGQGTIILHTKPKIIEINAEYNEIHTTQDHQEVKL